MPHAELLCTIFTNKYIQITARQFKFYTNKIIKTAATQDLHLFDEWQIYIDNIDLIYSSVMFDLFVTSGYAAMARNSRFATVTLHISPVFPTARQRERSSYVPTVSSRSVSSRFLINLHGMTDPLQFFFSDHFSVSQRQKGMVNSTPMSPWKMAKIR